MQIHKVLGPVALVAAVAIAVGNCTPAVRDVNGDGVEDGVPTTTVIAPSNPVGTITGLVLNATTGQPFPAGRKVTVHLTAGGLGGGSIGEEQTIEDGSGRFRFSDVPAGVGVSLEFSAENCAPAFAQVQLDAAAGNFPTDNAHTFVGPIELIELSGTLLAQVLAPDGQPLANADVYLDTDFSFFDDGTPSGRLHAAAATNGDGLATFGAIPDAAVLATRIGTRQYVLTVPPLDTNDDGVPNFTGTTRALSVATVALLASPVVLVLNYPTGSQPVHVVASNVADLVNPGGTTPLPVPVPSVVPKQGGAVTVAFNQPVDQASFLFRLVGESGGAPIPVTPAFSAYGNVVTVPLADAPGVNAGQEYNLYLEARPSQLGGGAAYRGAVAFFITPAVTEVKVDSFEHHENSGDGLINTGDYIMFRLNVPVGARRDDGTAASALEMLPIRVQVVGDVNNNGSQDDQPFEAAYQGNLPPPYATVYEELPPGSDYVASGYSTWLRLQLPAALPNSPPIQLTTGGMIVFTFTFNDPTYALPTQRLRVATPQGILPAPNNKSDILSFDPSARDGG